MRHYLLCVVASVIAASACGSGRKSGALISVAATTDMSVPGDLSHIEVSVFINGERAQAEKFNLAEESKLPVVVTAEGKPNDKVHVEVQGTLGTLVRVSRAADTWLVGGRHIRLNLELQWLCVRSEGASSLQCSDDETCVQGSCKPSAVDPKRLMENQDGGDQNVCFDVQKCFERDPVVPRSDDGKCLIDRPAGSSGVNVAIVLPPGVAGICDEQSCLVPLNGFDDLEGWTLPNANTVRLPDSVCSSFAAGAIKGVVASSKCPSKTVSVPSCIQATSANGKDAAANPSRDAGAPDVTVFVDAPVEKCSSATTCGPKDGCCPTSACTQNADEDCSPMCGNSVVEKGELCDKSCPVSCPRQGCEIRALKSPGTCQAECATESRETSCVGGDGCCPGGCTSQTDRDCDCKPTAEICNGIDDDCDNATDEDVKSQFFLDQDGDGYGDGQRPTFACTKPSQHSTNGNDCNDGLPSVYPGATESCNEIDDNCNDQKDEGLTKTFYRDADGDGYGTGSIAVVACVAPAGYVGDSSDCNDSAPNVRPGAEEVCNGYDDNCNRENDEGVQSTFYRDADGDGFGDKSQTTNACAAPSGYVADANDCNDSAPNVRPGATEECNGFDDNCNAQNDEGVLKTFYRDIDGDGFGANSPTATACSAPSGYAAVAGDCNDNDGAFKPTAVEVCDYKDNNCNTETDETCKSSVVTLSGLSELTARHFECLPGDFFSDRCFSASNRYCRSLGGNRGGYGPISLGSNSFSVTCLPNSNATLLSTSVAELTTYNPLCSEANYFSGQCSRAVHAYCIAKGYVTGIGPLEHQGYSPYYVNCLSTAKMLSLPPATLANYDAGCTPGTYFSSPCFNAYQKHCKANGYSSGFGPTGGTASSIEFACVP